MWASVVKSKNCYLLEGSEGILCRGLGQETSKMQDSTSFQNRRIFCFRKQENIA